MASRGQDGRAACEMAARAAGEMAARRAAVKVLRDGCAAVTVYDGQNLKHSPVSEGVESRKRSLMDR